MTSQITWIGYGSKASKVLVQAYQIHYQLSKYIHVYYAERLFVYRSNMRKKVKLDYDNCGI